MKRNFLLIILLLLCAQFSFSQNKYWISFKDKDTQHYDYCRYLSPRTIDNRLRFGLPLYQYTDVPVKQTYIDQLNKLGVQVLCKSRWINSVSSFLTAEQLSIVSALPFVEEVSEIDRNIRLTGTAIDPDPEFLHMAMKQMQSAVFDDLSITGKGVMIGVIDAGFYEANIDKYLLHLFDDNKIAIQRDFINPARTDLIKESATDSDEHGRMVLDMIAGYDPSEKIQKGLAVNATFYLARTEDGDHESRKEEDNWIMAMEWLDSLGVRLITTSLGYAIKMDDPKDNYTQDQMDGKTARISKAAQIAFDEKGIFVVASAGNEGDNPEWRIVSAPADAKGVLSVGATEQESLIKIGYSSIGPENLPYLKPNVSCFSPNGTSFSAPAVAGFVACLMEKAPNLSNKQLKDIIEKSGHLYPFGNNYLGYGIPQASRALKLIENPSYKPDNAIEKVAVGKYKLKLDKTIHNIPVEVFHKKNKTIVIKQEMLTMKRGKLIIKRIPGAVRTTFTITTQLVVEIVWED